MGHARATRERLMVTAAVLTYDGIELLDTVLNSLARQSFEDFRTVVVDNGSTDGTGAWLAERWPGVEVISLPQNVGVTAGLNRCLAAAEGSEFALLLNDDVELDPNCIERLVADLRAHPQAGAAGAKLLDFSRRELLDGAGDIYSWAGIAHRRGQGEEDRGQYDGLPDVFGACGAAAMYRVSALAAVGQFDEQLYAYCEDTDWCFRARLAGFGCRFVPGARVYHVGSASLGARISDFTLYQNWRNQIWLVAKNYPAAALVRHLPDLLLGVGATFYVAVRHRSVKVWLRAWRDALCGLPELLAKRRAVQRSRRVAPGELDEVIESGFGKLRWWLAGSGRATAPAAARQDAEERSRPAAEER
ncbi:MAG TPA: glycosyltransferase family 2 protein [Solirubrobacteraceae bacterium]